MLVGCIVTLRRVIKEVLTEKVMAEQRPERDEETGQRNNKRALRQRHA